VKPERPASRGVFHCRNRWVAASGCGKHERDAADRLAVLQRRRELPRRDGGPDRLTDLGRQCGIGLHGDDLARGVDLPPRLRRKHGEWVFAGLCSGEDGACDPHRHRGNP